MKVTLDQLAALQHQQKNIARNAPGEGFAQALAQELETGPVVAGLQSAVPTVPLAIHTALLQPPTERTVMEKMDSLLSQWENYSQCIAKDGNLRQGYALLTDIRNNIQTVKEDLAQKPGLGAGLHSMVEELDILTTTEEFKFNRGDYVN